VLRSEAESVAARFALGSVSTEPAPVARGATGFIWKLTTDRGAFAVKRLQPWVNDSAVPFDVGVQRAAADVGIPLPSPILTPDGEAIVDHTRVYAWADVHAQLEPPVSPDIAAEVGRLLGLLHGLELPPPQLDPGTWYEQPPTRDEWQHVLQTGIEGDTPWRDWLAQEIDFLAEVGREVAVPRTGRVITCHRDFAPGNVPPTADGSLVVLDWENAGPMVADVELASAIAWWTCDGERADLGAAHALHDAYRAVYPTGAPLVDASFHTNLVTHLNFLRVNLYNSTNVDEAGAFTDRWIELLHPEGLRRRLVGIRKVAAALTA